MGQPPGTEGMEMNGLINGVIKDTIIGLAREICELNAKMSDQWLEVQKCIDDDNRNDEAISALNIYFRLKADVEGVEARLKTMLHTHYPDR
jgi:hypothetical protein